MGSHFIGVTVGYGLLGHISYVNISIIFMYLGMSTTLTIVYLLYYAMQEVFATHYSVSF